MLDLELLEGVVPNIEDRTYGDLQELRLLTEEEIKDLALKNKDDDLCQDDILNLCITAMHYAKLKGSIARDINIPVVTLPYKPIITNEPYVSKGTPLDIRFCETTGVDKCTPVTCDEDYEFKRCMK